MSNGSSVLKVKQWRMNKNALWSKSTALRDRQVGYFPPAPGKLSNLVGPQVRDLPLPLRDCLRCDL